MQFTNILAVAVLLAGSALGAPAPEASKGKEPKQTPQPITVNQNQCGNGVTSYCCSTDNHGKYTTCKTMNSSSTCDQTTVCCQNNGNGKQECIGNAVITN